MTNLFENLIARSWNRIKRKRDDPASRYGLDLGFRIVDGQLSPQHLTIPHSKRSEHLVILGKTGSGKSHLLRHMAVQDIRAGRGFIFFDLHGDATPFLLRVIAQEEQRKGLDLSGRLIVIEPADPEFSVGLNVLERTDEQQRGFVQISELAEILKRRWHLESLGARTEELLRNSLHVLADNRLTLLELAPLLTNSAFRASCLARVTNAEVEAYFRSRYDLASEPMQAVLRDAILNKVSVFTSDSCFRHIVGQRQSTFSLADAIDTGCWVILNLNKGRLGEQATTLGSLFLTKIKNALFSRKDERLFTLYCDEIQNLVAFDSGIDTLLSEARKFGISIVSANQFLDQHPPLIRSAVLAVGTHVFFQLSSTDAPKIAAAVGAGKTLVNLLQNLPPRHMVVKSGHQRWQQAKVPDVDDPSVDSSSLYERCRNRWARPRALVEQEIRSRRTESEQSSNDVLHEWD